MKKDVLSVMKDLVKRKVLTEEQAMEALGRTRQLFRSDAVKRRACRGCGRDAWVLDYLCLSCSVSKAENQRRFWADVRERTGEPFFSPSIPSTKIA